MVCCHAHVNENLNPIESMKSCPNLATILSRRTQSEVLNHLLNELGCKVVHVSRTESYILVSKFQSRVAAVRNIVLTGTAAHVYNLCRWSV